jgi:hypothetical protein
MCGDTTCGCSQLTASSQPGTITAACTNEWSKHKAPCAPCPFECTGVWPQHSRAQHRVCARPRQRHRHSTPQQQGVPTQAPQTISKSTPQNRARAAPTSTNCRDKNMDTPVDICIMQHPDSTWQCISQQPGSTRHVVGQRPPTQPAIPSTRELSTHLHNTHNHPLGSQRSTGCCACSSPPNFTTGAFSALL